MSSQQNIQGLILAGGQGSRMGGVDKGLELWQEQPLVSYPLSAMSPLCSDILISCNRNSERYLALVKRVVLDKAPDYQGPLSGLVSALDQVTADWLLVSPCDTPKVTTSDFQRLLAAAESLPDQTLFALTDEHKSHPLHCLIHRSLFAEIAAAFEAGQRSVFKVFKALNVMWISTEAARMSNFNALEQLD